MSENDRCPRHELCEKEDLLVRIANALCGEKEETPEDRWREFLNG